MSQTTVVSADHRAPQRLSLDEYWMPFTPNREFKPDPALRDQEGRTARDRATTGTAACQTPAPQ